MRTPPKQFSPNELKAIWYHYGDARTAAKKLGIGTGTLIENATVDLKGRERRLREDVRERIEKHYNKLSPSAKRRIQKNMRDLNTLDAYPNVSKAILHSKPKDRKLMLDKFEEYKKKSNDEYTAWRGVMNIAYHRYNWRMGKWSK